jgi:hypothetical protein
MHLRSVRLFVFAVLLVAGLAAGLLTWSVERRIADLERAEQEIGSRFDRMEAAVPAIASAQQAYVAPGQPDGPWLEQTASLIQALSNDATAVGGRARSPQATPLLRTLAERLTEVVVVDARARGGLQAGDELSTAELIYGVGRRTLDAITHDLRELRAAEHAAFAAERANLRADAWTGLGVAALFWVIGASLLVPQRRGKSQVITPLPAATLFGVPDPPPALIASEPSAPAAPTGTVSPIDLPAAADVCTAFARMTSTTQLPDLLARAAVVLDASGLIVWMSAAEELFAVTTHGYDPRVISRLGPIPRDADNATAACWRTGEIGTVAGDVTSNGAIVAPLFGPDACNGVLAVEVRHGREGDAATRAVTAMIAAQLATAIAAWPAASTASPAATAATGS